MSPEQCEVTVLLPCLNEALTLEVCVRKAVRCLAELGVSGEVLVSDNGSTDGSQRIAERAGARVVDAPVRGYGAALINGIERARGRYVIMADADDSYDLGNLGPFIEALRDGHDLVMGNRFRGGIAPGAMPALHRYLGNPVLSRLGRMLFGLRSVGDFHCGMRGFDTARVRRLRPCMTGMEFASELVVRCALAGYDIAEVPTTLSRDGRDRAPHLRTWRDGWRHLRFLLAFAPRPTLLWPGLALALLGLVGVVTLAAGPVRIGGVRLGVDTLAYACLTVLVGVQVVLFGGFASLVCARELPPDLPVPVRRFRPLRLEVCLIAGLALMVGGVAGGALALHAWGRAGFGDLDPTGQLRVVLPSATAIAVGVTLVFAGVLAALLTARPFPTTATAPVPADRPDGDPPAPRSATTSDTVVVPAARRGGPAGGVTAGPAVVASDAAAS